MEIPPDTPFQTGWWGFDLGKYRPCDSTYRLYPYASLPPLAEPDESLSWLGPLDARVDAQMAPHRNRDDQRAALDELTAHARALALTLPPAFTALMSSPALQARIPSCTACQFDLAHLFQPCPGAESGYIATFLRDQQYCALWYLYLTPGGEQRILAFPGDMEDDLDAVEAGEAPLEDVVAAIRECAPSFTSFIYRFWLENTLWFKLHAREPQPFTEAEQAYLDCYTHQRASQN
jgi:hypothetical protein